MKSQSLQILNFVLAVSLACALTVSCQQNDKDSVQQNDAIYKALKRKKMDSPFPKEFKATFEFHDGIWTGDSMVGDQDIKDLTEKHSIEQLYLKRADITGKGIGYLKNEPIKNLRLQFMVLTPAILEEISKLDKIKDLCVYFTESINDKTILHLTGPRKLVYLNLAVTEIGDRGLAHVATSFPHLESICILRCENLTDRSWKSIGKIKSLKSISAYGVDFGAQAVNSIQRLKRLTSLEIGGSSITDNTILKLSKSVNSLNNLTIKNALITDKALFNLAKMSKIKKLRLENCPKLTRKSKDLARRKKSPIISIITSKETPKSKFRNRSALEELVKE